MMILFRLFFMLFKMVECKYDEVGIFILEYVIFMDMAKRGEMYGTT